MGRISTSVARCRGSLYMVLATSLVKTVGRVEVGSGGCCVLCAVCCVLYSVSTNHPAFMPALC